MRTGDGLRVDLAGQLGGGLIDAELRGRDRSGLLTQIPPLAALMAGVGPPVFASGPTAAALHGLDDYTLRPPFHLVVPRGRNITRVGHVVHTSSSLELIDRSTPLGIPSLSPTRTLLSLAEREPLDRVTAALDAALRDGLTSEDFLHRRLGQLRTHGRPGVHRLIEVIEGIEATRGGHSWLEREFLRLLAADGMPLPAMQQVLGRRDGRVIRVDARFLGTPVVVELLGYRFHRTRHQTLVDAQRMNRLQLDGFHVMQFTYAEVVDGPAAVVATVREALDRFAPSLSVTTEH